jgi:FSR family fosmidomycin resistance protein-like MFS transporter
VLLGKTRRRLSPTAITVLAALAVELVDELVDGTKSAALPLIRADLGLSYGQIGLLAGVPLIVGSFIELPMGVMAGEGSRRRAFVLGGGLVFIASLLGAAVAGTFGALLAAFVAFFPASGAFVSLTQATLMDADPSRREHSMARWTLAGAVGAVAGPPLLAAVVAAGGSWRTAYVLLAAVAGAAWLGLAGAGRPGRTGQADADGRAARRPDAVPAPASDAVPDDAVPAAAADAGAGGCAADADSDEAAGSDEDADVDEDAEPAGLRQALAGLRDGSVVRWLVLLEVADLLLDVFSAFVALYLVAATHVSPAHAVLGVGVRMAADLAGSAALIPLLERVSGALVLRISAAMAVVLFPAFLLVPGFWPKVGVLAALSVVTAAWYPVLQAELYHSLPGRSGVAVSLLSVAGLVGGLGPLTVGFLAERLGLSWALALLAVVPPCILAGVWSARRPAAPSRGQPRV